MISPEFYQPQNVRVKKGFYELVKRGRGNSSVKLNGVPKTLTLLCGVTV